MMGLYSSSQGERSDSVFSSVTIQGYFNELKLQIESGLKVARHLFSFLSQYCSGILSC